MDRIRISTKHGIWFTNENNLTSATWDNNGESNPHYVSTMGEVYGYGGGDENTLCIMEGDGDGDWSSIETSNLLAEDEDGNPVTLYLSAAKIWSEDGRDSYIAYPMDRNIGGRLEDPEWWADEADVEEDGGYEETLHVDALCNLVGVDLDGPDSIDYKGAVDTWVDENCDGNTRYWLDDCRGFANEWSIYIDTEGRDELTCGDLDGTVNPEPADHLTELDEDEARKYIIDAVMTDGDYESEHGCESCVAAVLL